MPKKSLRNIGPMLPGFETLETAEHIISRPLIALPADSPAKILARLERRSASTDYVVDCGASLPESLANYDPATSSWKTSQICLTGELAEYSATLPRSGTMRNGKLYRRAPLVRHIHVSACSLLPTLTVASCEHPGRIKIKPDQQDCLSAAVARRDGHRLGGQLNPAWTAWFMGFPASWTDLEDSETP